MQFCVYQPEKETSFLSHLLSTQKTWAEVWQEQAGLPSETQVKTEPQTWGRLESRVSLVQYLLLYIEKANSVLILLANYCLKPYNGDSGTYTNKWTFSGLSL